MNEILNPSFESKKADASPSGGGIVFSIEQALKCAIALGMTIESTFYNNEFTSVTGLKDGHKITIMQYREVAKNA